MKPGYKVVHEDEHLFHIQDHKGQTFAVAKKAIGPKLSGQIQKLYGGTDDVEPAAAPVDPLQGLVPSNLGELAQGQQALAAANPQAPAPDAPQELLGSKTLGYLANKFSGLQDNLGKVEAAKAAGQDISQMQFKDGQLITNPSTAGVPLSLQAPDADTQGMPATDGQIGTQAAPSSPSDPYAGIPGMDDIVKGAKMGAGATIQLGKDNQAALAQAQKDSDARAYDTKARLNDIDLDQDNLRQSILDGKIDPHRMWNNKSTAGKIGATIGLILGGIGSGLTHTPNAALQVLQKAQDDDIEAQKADLGKNNTLYSMNLQKYHSVEAADAATRLQQNTALQTQLQMNISKAGSTQAAAGLMSVLGNYKQQAQILRSQLAVTQANNAALGVGSGEGGIPVGKEPAGLLGNEKYAKRRVEVSGKAYQAADDKGADELRTSQSLLNPIERDIGTLRAMGPGAIVDPSQRKVAEGIMGRLAMNMNEFNGYKRFTDVDKDTLSAQVNNPTTMASLLQGDSSSVDALKAMRGKMESERAQKLIGYKGAGSIGSFQPIQGKLPLNGR